METPDTPRERGTTPSTNVAIVAIAVILVIAVIAFFILFRPGPDIAEQPDDPRIEFEIEPPPAEPQPDFDELVPDNFQSDTL